MAAKLKDVAAAAGVSPATVSRVLNHKSNVAPEIQQTVMQAAERLNYVRNGAASALRSTSSRLAGVVIPTLSHSIYATMTDGLQGRLAERGVSLIIATSLYDLEVEYEQVRLLIERGVESLVVVGSEHKPHTIDLMESHNVPFVCTYTTTTVSRGAAAGFDNVKAAQTAARYLLDLGHRRFGMIAGLTRDNDRARERRDGFLSALHAAGVTDTSVAESSYDFDGGARAMADIVRQDPYVTAVFCGSDILAGGAIRWCRDNAVVVPDQISVLGFDNLAFADVMTPGLSTLEVPAAAMGRAAAEYILAKPAQRLHIQRSELTVNLILRGSTGPVARKD